MHSSPRIRVRGPRTLTCLAEGLVALCHKLWQNLDYMLAFTKAWPDEAIMQQLAAKIPWYHNLTLIEKLDSREVRLWYADMAFQPGKITA